jgi:ribosomal protein S18 acetylase RimI-like enzyme
MDYDFVFAPVIIPHGRRQAGFHARTGRDRIAGYIQTVCVRADRRGQGLGAALIQFAEERIFRDSPNVFMCVSSFNADGRRLYERLGYEQIALRRAFVVARRGRRQSPVWKS